MRKSKLLVMEEAIWDLLIEIAKSEDRTVTGLIRSAIKEYLFNHYGKKIT